MALFLRWRPLCSQTLGLGMGLTLAASQAGWQRPMLLDSGSTTVRDPSKWYTETKRSRNGNMNPKTVRHISSGSIIGLCAGLVVSTFSRSLALILGLLVVGVQWASSYDIWVLPYDKLQRYVTTFDLRSAIQDNAAFKVSFGATFILAAFMQF